MKFALPLLPVLPAFERQTHDPQDIDWRAGDASGPPGGQPETEQ